MMFLLLLSFFFFYEKASYAVLIILAIATIGITVTSQFDNSSTTFVLPFILGAFSLFSWKKGLIYSGILLSILILIIFKYYNHFSSSIFLHNDIAIFNFIFILIIISVFAFYYETTRVDSYKVLLNSNYRKDLLYNEIHHRVKNNLNIVSSMLALQAETEEQKVQDIINVSKNRIDSMAMVHSMLYVSEGIEKVNAKLFIEQLSSTLSQTFNTNITIIFRLKTVELSLNEIIPIGLIINELLTNSFKYAFKKTPNPKIIIGLTLHKDQVLLTYFDNGIGLADNNVPSLGLKLVTLNVKQLKGDLKVHYNNGLHYKITYKRSEQHV
ncbi:MAG: sensor histidine kinase [Sulfurospirillaceae bacterium]|nr:sensor histidine kinase [Sulfurospirillaceae bacterium]MDD2827718.1 sensor histidine kinase [Sulfurospirillaceae bacterium]